jgi:hypothetical protein
MTVNAGLDGEHLNGDKAPPIGRMTVWTASQAESIHGIFVREELEEIEDARNRNDHRIPSTSSD